MQKARPASKEHNCTGSSLWWGKMILILIFSLFFLMFGIENLVGAFQLKNPLEFIASFFSSSLMILVSLVGVIYPVLRVHSCIKIYKTGNDEK